MKTPGRRAHRPEVLPDEERWNNNNHYFPKLLALTPAVRVLDVGCGEGVLTRLLAPTSGSVVGIDPDKSSVELARASTSLENVEYIQADVMTHDFEAESFDLVVAVLMLHHVDARTGLERFRELVSPGGQIGIIGIGAERIPQDLPRLAARLIASHTLRLRRTYWEHTAPIVWPPPLTDDGYREVADAVLPGNTFRRHLLGRHTIIWTKPNE